jgi:hypothetical protein
MAGVAHYDMVKHFDFEKLPGAYQVARNLYVGFGRRRLAAYAANGISGVIPQPVLCRTAHDSPHFSGSEQLSRAA